MKTLKVNINAREGSGNVKYQHSSITVIKEPFFPVNQMEKEVNSLSKKEKKKLLKITRSFLLTSISFLTFASKSMATTSVDTIATIPKLPTELTEVLAILIKTSLVGSVGLAAVLLILAGVMRMLRKKREAVEWTSDIIKGLTQILIAVPLVFIIYYVATTLLGTVDVFLNTL